MHATSWSRRLPFMLHCWSASRSIGMLLAFIPQERWRQCGGPAQHSMTHSTPRFLASNTATHTLAQATGLQACSMPSMPAATLPKLCHIAVNEALAVAVSHSMIILRKHHCKGAETRPGFRI
eukprot:jgi/Ulvmu1/5559/UM023_0096.1